MKIKTKMDKIKGVIQNSILKTKLISLKWLLINSKQFTIKEKKKENKDGTIENIEKENTENVISKLKKIDNIDKIISVCVL